MLWRQVYDPSPGMCKWTNSRIVWHWVQQTRVCVGSNTAVSAIGCSEAKNHRHYRDNLGPDNFTFPKDELLVTQSGSGS